MRADYLKIGKMLDEKNRNLSEKIRSRKLSVAVHVRGGDYNNPVNKEILGELCGIEYYRKAFGFFESRFESCYFYIFTNDSEYARKILPVRKNCKYIQNSEANGIQDMILMSQCRHNIIANSTFSWWGAWMNPGHDKIVIAPVRWKNKVVANPNCEDWIEI